MVLAVVAPRLPTRNTDFDLYYSTTRAFFVSGVDPYDAGCIVKHIGFNYPPLSLAMFRPFLLLARVPAHLAFIGLSYLLLPLVAELVRRTCSPALPRRSLLALTLSAVVCVVGPQFENIAMGNVNALVLVACLGFVVLVERDRPIAGGLVLSLGCWLKVFPALLALVALRDPRYRRALLGVALGGVLVPLLFLPIVPPSLYVRYFRDVLPSLSRVTAAEILNASIPGVVARAHLTSFAALRGDECFAIPVAERAILDGVVCAVVAWLALVYLRRGGAERRVTAIVVVMAITPLVLPLGWGYTYVLAVPLLWRGLAIGLERGGLRFVAAAAALLALYVPSWTFFGALSRAPLFVAELVYARHPLAVVLLVALVSGAPTRPAGILD